MCALEFNVAFLQMAHGSLLRAVSGVGSWLMWVFLVCRVGFERPMSCMATRSGRLSLAVHDAVLCAWWLMWALTCVLVFFLAGA